MVITEKLNQEASHKKMKEDMTEYLRLAVEKQSEEKLEEKLLVMDFVQLLFPTMTDKLNRE